LEKKNHFLDPQRIISSWNYDRLGGTPHCLAVRGSFRGPSFHAGLESAITLSKKIEKYKTFMWRHFM
jgi:hypothetical protein